MLMGLYEMTRTPYTMQSVRSHNTQPSSRRPELVAHVKLKVTTLFPQPVQEVFAPEPTYSDILC